MAFPELAPLFPKWNGRENLDTSPSFPAGLTSKGSGRDGPVYQALAAWVLESGVSAWLHTVSLYLASVPFPQIANLE